MKFDDKMNTSSTFEEQTKNNGVKVNNTFSHTIAQTTELYVKFVRESTSTYLKIENRTYQPGSTTSVIIVAQFLTKSKQHPSPSMQPMYPFSFKTINGGKQN